jgi:PKD domain
MVIMVKLPVNLILTYMKRSVFPFFALLGLLVSWEVSWAQPLVTSSASLTQVSPGVFTGYYCDGVGILLATDSLAASYLWSTGSGGPHIHYVSPSPQDDDTVWVTATDAFGNSSTSIIYLQPTVAPSPPTVSLPPSGIWQACAGDSLLLIGNFNPGGAMRWENGHIVANHGDCDVPMANNQCGEYFTATAMGYYELIMNGTECTYGSNYQNLYVYPIPATPSIIRSGDTLIASVQASAYIWLDSNGVAVPNWPYRWFIPLQSGSYRVVADGAGWLVNCYSDTSAAVSYTAGCTAQYGWQLDPFGLSTIVLINGSFPLAASGGHYLWDFGDGSTDTTENPTHQYASPGTYQICVTVSNSICTATYCDSLTVLNKVDAPLSIRVVRSLVGVRDPQAGGAVQLWPNPASSEFHLDLELTQTARTRMSLLDLRGHLLRELPPVTLIPGRHSLSMPTDGLAPGTYLLRLQRGEQVDVLKAVIGD